MGGRLSTSGALVHRERSTKYVNGSRSFTRFASDRVLDFVDRHGVIVGERRDRFAGAVAFRDDTGLNSGASNYRLSETTSWIDDDAPWLRRVEVSADPRIEPFGDVTTPFDALQACVEHMLE